MRKILAVFALLLIFFQPAFAAAGNITINPKQMDYMEVRIIQSGALAVSGQVSSADVFLSTPQEGVVSRYAASGSGSFSWETTRDNMSNERVHLKWKSPSGKIDYKVETVVRSVAKLLPAPKKLASDREYLLENSQVVFTEEMRRIAYPYGNSLEKAAELTKWVHNYVNYDLGMAGQLKPSDWVLENRRGVCVEYANLLSSLMKISGIPNRYVTGYAYSSIENKLIGHTWVEVLAADGAWIPFDATWLQGGYLDASHIKTAAGENANQTEILTYFGIGSISWQRDEDGIQVIDYTLRNTTHISLETTDISFGEAGYIKAASVPETCTITDISAASCLGDNGKELLDVYDANRQLWQCAPEDIYWLFSAADADRNYVYTCPVSVYDQSGAGSSGNVAVKGARAQKAVSISGPDVVSVNEAFSLRADAGGDMIFYSPNLTMHEGRLWQLRLQRPGSYRFYLYSGGSMAEKTVTVADKKEFDVVLTAPENATMGSTVTAELTARNLYSKPKQAAVVIELDGSEVFRETVIFDGGELKRAGYNITVSSRGGKVSAFLLADSVSGYTTYMKVHETKPPGNSIMDFLSWVVAAVSGFFGQLFGK